MKARPGGYSLTFNMRGSVPIFGVQSLTLNQYLGFANNKGGRNSIFAVHKFDEGKNHAIWYDLLQ